MQWLCGILHSRYMELNVNIAIFQTKKIKSDSIQPRPEHHILLACVHSHSIQGFHSLPASEASVNVIVFSSQHGRHPRTVSLSGCMTKQSRWWYVDQSNPDFTHISDDITRRKDFFFFFEDCPQDPCLAPMANLHWVLKCRGFNDPDTLWRTRFADIRVKTRMGSLAMNCSVERHNVVGCPAAWKENRKRSKTHNLYKSQLFFVRIWWVFP